MSEQLGEAVLTLRTDDRGLDAGIDKAEGKSKKLGSTLDATSGSAMRMGKALTGAGQDAATGAAGLEKNAGAAKALAAANDTVTKSGGAQRAGMQQLGMQINDMATMYSLGARPMQIFSSQIGQVTQAMQLMSGGTSALASFLGGPWFLAASTAAIVLLPFITNLLDSGEAADSTKAKTYDFSKSLSVLKLDAKDAADAMAQLAKETRDAIKEQGSFYSQRAATAGQAVNDLTKQIADKQAEIDALEKRAAIGVSTGTPMGVADAARAIYELSRAKGELAKLKSALRDAGQAVTNVTLGEEQRAAINAVDAQAAATDRYTEALGKLNTRRRESIELDKQLGNAMPGYAAATRAQMPGGYLSAGNYAGEMARIRKERDDAIEAARKAERDAKKDANETSSFVSPVTGARTGKFGEQRPGHIHAGVDLAVPVGTSVRAPAGGTVIEAGTVPGYGNVVFIDHGGGTITRLAHLSKIGVSKGQSVDQGDVIGLSGGARGAPGAGNSQGPHLHYEVRVNGKPVDPSKGPFPTDAMGAASKAADAAERAAAKAERDREQKERRDRAFESASAQLDDQLLEQKRHGLTDEEAIAQVKRDQVQVASDKFNAETRSKEATGDLTKAQADELIVKHAILSGLQVQLINIEEQARKIGDAADVALRMSELQLDVLHLQENLAQTTAQRRDLALDILAEEEKQIRIEAQRTLALFKLGQATQDQADKAQASLDRLDELHPLKVEQINQQNQGPLDRYLADTDPAKNDERVERYFVDRVEQFNQSMTDAVSSVLGVEDPFLKSLISMFIEQNLIRPMMEALQSSKGGGGGGLLGTLLGLGGSLLGGGMGNIAGVASNFAPSASLVSGASSAMSSFAGLFATGGLIPNGSYGIVGENGPEPIFATGGGVGVLPNSALKPFEGGRGGDTFNSTYIVPRVADSRVTRSAVARGQQLAMGQANRKGLAR